MSLPALTSQALSTQSLNVDSRSLGTLKAQAAIDPQAAVHQVAKQLESLFMQELMKSMRQTTMASGLMDNQASSMGNDMLDQQYATQLSGMPGGLADLIARQLQHQVGTAPSGLSMSLSSTPSLGALTAGGSSASAASTTSSATSASPATEATSTSTSPTSSINSDAHPMSLKDRAVDFVRRHLSAAMNAQAATGIPATNLLGQAAHESGWGRHEIRNADGSGSHNLFGIKAGADWKGPVARVTTTEYVNGQPHRVVASFRSYASYDEAFADHARLLKSNPRYSQVIANGSTASGFANSLQRAGYATDPAYAKKLTNIINTTVRLQRLVT